MPLRVLCRHFHALPLLHWVPPGPKVVVPLMLVDSLAIVIEDNLNEGAQPFPVLLHLAALCVPLR